MSGGMSIRVARTADLGTVLDLLNGSAAWLRQLGEDQWARGFDAARIGPAVERGHTLLAEWHGEPVATVAVTPDGDTDFWTPAELLEPAWYVSKLAVSREHAGHDLGGWVLRKVTDQAAAAGMRWVRLDAWLTNTRLHQWYLARGWTQVRLEPVRDRRSGALFQRPAAADPAARRFFGPREMLERLTRPPLAEGTAVEVLPVHQRGHVEAVHLADYGQPEAGPAPEYPQRSYTVRMADGSRRTCGDASLDVAS
jgi:GNAT superfamily N-acetyltransferase